MKPNKHRLFSVVATAVIALAAVSCYSPADQMPVDNSDLMSDTWVATDALGRQMPQIDSVGFTKDDQRRVVGMFYITWHGDWYGALPGPYTDVTKILQEKPEARLDGTDPLWKYGQYHWGEPEMGYFLSYDEWVYRKDISMLQDAGVDVLVMDVTNGVCYWDQWEILFSTMMKMREEGNETPQFIFWSYNNKPVEVVTSLYERYYKQNKFSDLWFYWDGKPLLLYNADPSFDANGEYENAPEYPQEILDYFTLRNMWWGRDEWQGQNWLGQEDCWNFGYDIHVPSIKNLPPEKLAGMHNGKFEQMAVTAAQHPCTYVGKSWSREHGQPDLNEYDMPEKAYVPWLGKTVEDPTAYGIYFQERWEDALAVEPEFIYLNDWNEWIAGKYGWDDPWLERHSNFWFVDQYNAEFNRTIQPMKDGYTDNYYMQMAQNIRRYKGVRPIPENKGFKKIAIDGKFEDWSKVGVEYRDTRGDVTSRDGAGYAGLRYTEDTGRNDIQDSKVTITKDGQVCFYAKTGSDITPYTDNNWMLLLIDADQNTETGWYGYDFMVNKKVQDTGTTEVMKYENGNWTTVASVPYAVTGNEIELSVPAELLGVSGKFASFDFKWADNPQELKDPISLCLHGDTAPNRRFNYRFIWNK